MTPLHSAAGKGLLWFHSRIDYRIPYSWTPYRPLDPETIMDLLEHGHLLTASELAQAAQEARHFAELSQQEAARRLGVAQATLAQAESAPKRSLQALRSRMVGELSAGMEVSGPYFVVKHRGMTLHDGDYFR